MLYIAICDDETTDLIYEKELIESILPSIVTDDKWEIDMFTSSKDMLKRNRQYNMIFLDVEMGGRNGLETAETLHIKSPATLIFFVTHHETYMDEALNKHAFRFWTKPINRARLIYGIQSAVKEISIYRKSITVTVDKKKLKIFLRDIIYIHHSNRLTYIITTSGTYETRDTFKSVIKQLTDAYFVETHASCYVNLNYVSYYNKADIICEYNGKSYKAFISKRKYSAFKKRFREWSGGLQ